MSSKRVSTLGFCGIVLLQLLACSSQSSKGPSGTRDLNQQKENVDPDFDPGDLDEGGAPNTDPPNKTTDSGAGGSQAGDVQTGGSGSQTGDFQTGGSGSQTQQPTCLKTDGSFDYDAIKWRNQLKKPPVYAPIKTDADGTEHYKVTVHGADLQMLPDCLPTTRVFAYAWKVNENGVEKSSAYYSPGPTFVMKRGTKATVEWINDIDEKHVLSDDVSDIPSPVPIVAHAHGLEVASASDGAPEGWFTRDGTHGKKFGTKASTPGSTLYEYLNLQPATALWYHDHTFGITRLNVYAGLAGMYIIRDPTNEPKGFTPPDDAHEWPLVIQDRSFKPSGQLSYTSSGEMIAVNGQVWPNMQVDQTTYRFRVLNGSNSRFYTLALPDDNKITVIGSDGGYLAAQTAVSSLSLAPGERADILIDFSALKPGQSIIMSDTAGSSPVVRFSVPAKTTDVATPAPEKPPSLAAPKGVPDALNNISDLKEGDAPARTVTLQLGDRYLLNGQAWDGAISELPQVGSTEDWNIVNLTDEDHPMHVHLVQFRIISRQGFNRQAYQNEWTRQNPDPLPLSKPTVSVAMTKDYLTGTPDKPSLAEAGWKDTVVVPVGTVTTIRIRWAPQDAKSATPGTNPFVFDPTQGPGYVWHCHMLEHEDNEMMRPFQLSLKKQN